MGWAKAEECPAGFALPDPEAQIIGNNDGNFEGCPNTLDGWVALQPQLSFPGRHRGPKASADIAAADEAETTEDTCDADADAAKINILCAKSAGHRAGQEIAVAGAATEVPAGAPSYLAKEVTAVVADDHRGLPASAQTGDGWFLTLCSLGGRTETIGPLCPSSFLKHFRELAAEAFGESCGIVQLCFGAELLTQEWQSLSLLGLYDGATLTFLRRKVCGPCGYWHQDDGSRSHMLKGCRFCNYGWTRTEEETKVVVEMSQGNRWRLSSSL